MGAFTRSFLKPVSHFGQYSFLSRCLGVLLLTAAALKLHGLRVDAVPSFGLLSSPEVKVALVEFELFLGVWLLSGKGRVGSWLVALGTFSTFAAASAYQGWIGQASCGCFGRLSQYIKPWHTFTLDVSVVVLLGLARPDLTALRANPKVAVRVALLPLAGAAVGVLAVLGLFIGVAHVVYGTTDAALEHVRGDRLSVRPRLLDVGQHAAREDLEYQVTVVNHTDHPVCIIGGSADCSCVATEDLPLTLEPGEARSISIFVRLPGNTGIFNRRVALLTDDHIAPTISFRLTARVVPVNDVAAPLAERD